MLHRHPEVSLEVMEVETLLILLENLFDLPLELGDPVSRWMFSASRNIIFPFLGENMSSFALSLFCVDFRCVHRFQLLNVCNHYVTLPNSPRVQSVSKEKNPGNTFFPN